MQGAKIARSRALSAGIPAGSSRHQQQRSCPRPHQTRSHDDIRRRTASHNLIVASKVRRNLASARQVAADGSHAESDGIDNNNVVYALACSLHGEERVIRPIIGTRFSTLVNDEPFVGMHYCNYGPGSEELRRLVEGGMVIEATAEDAKAEVIELPRNRFFMLTLFQPQIGALARKPVHALLREFVRCARLQAAAA